MSTYVVAAFPDEASAYKGVSAFKDLHAEGSITLYGTIVVQRDAEGRLTTKQRTPELAIGAGLGSLLGALVGAFGGPAGAAIGFAAGGAAGGVGGLVHGDVSEEFLEDITKEFEPGMCAVLAEVTEEWTAPVDIRIEALGGRVVREDRSDVVEDILEKRAEARRAAFAEKKAVRQSRKAEKMEAKLDRELTTAREKLQRTAEKAQKRLVVMKEEMGDKLRTLEQQATKAKPDTRKEIDARITAIRKEFGEREQKLSHAYSIAQEALR